MFVSQALLLRQVLYCCPCIWYPGEQVRTDMYTPSLYSILATLFTGTYGAPQGILII